MPEQLERDEVTRTTKLLHSRDRMPRGEKHVAQFGAMVFLRMVMFWTQEMAQMALVREHDRGGPSMVSNRNHTQQRQGRIKSIGPRGLRARLFVVTKREGVTARQGSKGE